MDPQEQQPKSQVGNDVSGQAAEAAPPTVDWHLQTLVSLVNRSYETDMQIGLVLQVRGTLVSGLLVHGRRYFEGFAEEFASVFAAESADVIRRTYAEYGDIYPEAQDGQISNAPPPGFIHLKNATLLVGEKLVPANRGVWWRGRLSEVDGFFLGTLGAGS